MGCIMRGPCGGIIYQALSGSVRTIWGHLAQVRACRCPGQLLRPPLGLSLIWCTPDEVYVDNSKLFCFMLKVNKSSFNMKKYLHM